MNKMKIFSIGKIENKENHVCVKLDSKYAKGLKGLQGFSHIQILWWANQADRDTLSEVKPYKKGPETLGGICHAFTGKTKSDSSIEY